jgi:hypothetical protein
VPPDELVQRLDFTRLDVGNRRTTPAGGIIVKARISRTGILEYRNPDGSTRRELRLPEDVFAKPALDSFADATLTELHPAGLITPLSWRQHAVGHVAGAPVQDGEFAAADLHFEHADAIRKVESGENSELSCGYQCRVDATPGVHPKYGKFDARQYEITGNHVAVGPKGWGRSGSNVALHLDGELLAGALASGLEAAPYVPAKMPPDPPAVVVPPVVPPAPVVTDAALLGKVAVLEAENKRARRRPRRKKKRPAATPPSMRASLSSRPPSRTSTRSGRTRGRATTRSAARSSPRSSPGSSSPT